MFKRICKITFITHGETVYSINGIINNNIKSPKLNEFGEEEIGQVCDYLKKRGVAYDKIYTSPNACCTQSAQIIARMFKKKPEVIDLLPRRYGDWHGTSVIELFKEYGTKILAQTPKNGEALEVFNKRVDEYVSKLISKNQGSRIIVVTTPDVVQSALAKALELSPENQYKNLIKTGSLTQISYFEGWSSVIYSDYKPL